MDVASACDGVDDAANRSGFPEHAHLRACEAKYDATYGCLIGIDVYAHPMLHTKVIRKRLGQQCSNICPTVGSPAGELEALEHIYLTLPALLRLRYRDTNERQHACGA